MTEIATTSGPAGRRGLLVASANKKIDPTTLSASSLAARRVKKAVKVEPRSVFSRRRSVPRLDMHSGHADASTLYGHSATPNKYSGAAVLLRHKTFPVRGQARTLWCASRRHVVTTTKACDEGETPAHRIASPCP